jgi:hypothetical protein
MTKIVRRWPVFFLVLSWLSAAVPARAHAGPPFPILMDQKAGPYVASVWTDPDVGTGVFFVVLEPPAGTTLPEGTRVRIGVQPVTGRLPEAVYTAEVQSARGESTRYFTEASFDRQEMWKVRVLLDGSEGGGELAAEVEATPDGTIGPIALLIYPLPFLAVGFLWLKAALRRRSGTLNTGTPNAVDSARSSSSSEPRTEEG